MKGSLRIRHLFSELRRRRVFNTVAIYIVGAWVVLQVTDLALPGLDIPGSAIRSVWFGAFLLFPLVLVLGWRYDISTAGIRRTPKKEDGTGADTSLRKPDRWVIAALSVLTLAVITATLYKIIGEEQKEIVIAPQDYSIAVVPFAVCKDRGSDQTLAGGVTGEVIIHLARRDRLKVTGRATAFKLASLDSSTREVSELTGTDYVLTGMLCREGINLTLNAEVTDEAGFIVWRKRFIEVTNQFEQVKERLARLVADGVAVELGGVAGNATDKPVNRQAYEQMLIGREYCRQGHTEKARDAFRQALHYQPDMTEAVWELAALELNSGELDNAGSATGKAWPLREQALELALEELESGVPNFNAHRIAGEILHSLAVLDLERTWRNAVALGEEEVADRQTVNSRQLKKAQQHFRSALTLNPSDSQVRVWLAESLQYQDVHQYKESTDILVKGQSLDPFNAAFSKNLANQLAYLGQYRQALEVLNRFEVLPGGKRPVYEAQLELMGNYGRYDDKLATLIEILETDPEGAGFGFLSHLWRAPTEVASLGANEEAELLYDLAEQIPYPADDSRVSRTREIFLEDNYLESIDHGDEVIQKRMARITGMSTEQILDVPFVWADIHADTLWKSRQHAQAIELMESLRHVQQSPIWSEQQINRTLFLAEMYREVGRSEEAIPLLESAVKRLEKEFDAGIRHPATLGGLASAYCISGKGDAALEMLDLMTDYGGWSLLKGMNRPGNPYTQCWSQLKDDSRYTRSLNRMQSIRDYQAANVRNLMKLYDMSKLLEPLFEAVQRPVNFSGSNE